MSEQFKVGDLVITQHLARHPELNGTECEVIEGLAMREWECSATGEEGFSLTYKIRWPDGDITVQSPHELRRRKPPAADSNERMYVQRWRDMSDKAPQRQGATV